MKNRVVMLVMVGMLVLGGCGAQDTVEPSTSTVESLSQESTKESESTEAESSVEESSEPKQEVGYKFTIRSSTVDESGTVYLNITQPVGYAKGRESLGGSYWTVGLTSGHQTAMVADHGYALEEITGLEDVFNKVFVQQAAYSDLESIYGENLIFEETGNELQEVHGYQVCKHTGNLSYTDGDSGTFTKPYVAYSLESHGVPGAYLSFIIVDDGDREDVVADAEYMIGTIKENVYRLNGKLVD